MDFQSLLELVPLLDYYLLVMGVAGKISALVFAGDNDFWSYLRIFFFQK